MKHERAGSKLSMSERPTQTGRALPFIRNAASAWLRYARIFSTTCRRQCTTMASKCAICSMCRQLVPGTLVDQQFDESEPLRFVDRFGEQFAVTRIIESRILLIHSRAPI